MKIYENAIYRNSLRKLIDELPNKTAKFLVTGATGLIGSCIVDVLLMACQEIKRDYVVYAIGRDRERLIQRFKYAEKSGRLNVLVQDMMEPLSGEIEVDYIIHAASNADPCTYALYPTETLVANIYGANNIFQYCKTH